MKTETCGKCGCAFSWDNSGFFGATPALSGFSYICPECAREKAEQTRHDEREQEAERRHRERMDADRADRDQRNEVSDELADLERKIQARQDHKDRVNKWYKSPVGELYLKWWEKGGRLNAAVGEQIGFSSEYKLKLDLLSPDEQLEILISKDSEIVDFWEKHRAHIDKFNGQLTKYLLFIMAPLCMLPLKIFLPYEVPSPIWGFIPGVGHILAGFWIIAALSKQHFVTAFFAMSISGGMWVYLKQRKIEPLIKF